MANHHFGKFADVWKHLVLNEVLADVKPARYAETHAGSATYPLTDDAERRFGVLGFLEWSGSQPLSSTVFRSAVSEFASARPASYPGSALQAMTLLRDHTTYMLCDLDPVSAQGLRSWATNLDLTKCEVAERDGMAAVHEWMTGTASTVVHIDPFDPFAHEEGVPSAVQLAAKVADAGHTLVYWYGYSAPSERAWAVEEIRSGTTAKLWWGDFLTTTADGSVRDDGDIGVSTSAGTGSGVVLANVSENLVSRCEKLATALQAIYEDRRLPDGTLGRLDLAMGTST